MSINWDDEHVSRPIVYPVYREIGQIQVDRGYGHSPLVAMALAIQDDAATAGGSYIVRMDNMTITMAVELDQP
jgi:hypothetical protein